MRTHAKDFLKSVIIHNLDNSEHLFLVKHHKENTAKIIICWCPSGRGDPLTKNTPVRDA